jgi:hypothetical protein
MNNSGWNMYVFRNGRRTISGAVLISSLISALRRWRSQSESDSEDCAVEALIAAGELECALLDGASDPAYKSGNSASCNVASEITEALSCAFLTRQRHLLLSILQKAEQVRVAPSYEVAVQEGFAYYALNPRKIVMLIDELVPQRRMAVIGIRSIGVTLSAVACASLRLRGIECQRITVRPTGHPYDRSLEITQDLCQWIEHSRDTGFLIVDEGPGISGSSFLSVAEALVQCGVDKERIHMIGSRSVDPATLRATNAAERWTRYNFHIMQNAPLPPASAGEGISGGIWRQRFPYEESAMPASWAPLEPAKFLAADGRSIFKFEGFGHYGEEIGSRAKLLASFGFSPRYLGNYRGFGQYELVAGSLLNLRDRSPELLERVAEYIALRSTVFACDTPQTPELEKMLCWNWQVEFGEELTAEDAQLRAERVVVCDGRMMPHEWLRSSTGELLKLDAGIHGDNHFFPGPCDIAWDVAGAIVEWEMQGDVCNHFVRDYEARSGDVITQRLAPYLLAYTTFYMGWSKMAALAMQGEYDEALLQRDYQRYRAFAMRLRQKQWKFFEEKERSANAGPSLRSA